MLISPEWCASKWCFHEFKFAKALGKKIFPVLIRKTPWGELPAELTSIFQIADMSDPDNLEDGRTRLRFGLQRAGLDPKHFILPAGRAPYRGLKALEEEDAAIFFGRNAQITAGLDALRQMRGGAPHRILTVAASSGAGKSSFLKAGLLARLGRDEENFLVLPVWRPMRDALSGDTGLANALGGADLETALKALCNLQDVVVRRFEGLAAAAREKWRGAPPSLVLPFDQSEELFSGDNSTAAEAIELLIAILAKKPDLLVIATIRSDSLGRLQANSRLASQLHLFNLPALSPAAFKEVIEGPAALAVPPIQISPALTEKLIGDLDKADALPLLAFTMERLVQDYGNDQVLDLREYEGGLGGLKGAISAAVDASFAKAADDPSISMDRAAMDLLARAAFIPWLVQIDEADAVPRRQVRPLNDLPEATRPIIRHLIDERLLVSQEVDGQTVVEVSHEAVLRHWDQLADWISEERVTLETREQVRRAAQTWVKGDLARDLLLHRGELLRSAEALLRRADFAKDLEGEPTEYVAACRAAEDALIEQEQSQMRRTRRWQQALGALIMVASVGLLWGAWSLAQGERALHRNYSSILIQDSANAEEARQSGRALRLAILASRDSALAPSAPDARIRLTEAMRTVEWVTVLRNGAAAINSAAISSDGGSILTTSYNSTASVWRITKDGIWVGAILTGHTGEVTSGGFSPNARRIVTASTDHTARVWHFGSDGRWQSSALVGHGGWVTSATFDPSGENILTASTDNSARLWSKGENGEWESTVLSGHQSRVNSAAFSPNGTHVVTASDDGTARWWRRDPSGSWVSFALVGHGAAVNSAAFSPQGDRIVTSSQDNTARVWSVTKDETWEGIALEGHRREVLSSAFSPDGTRIVTASRDGTARVWNRGAKGEWQSTPLEGHRGSVGFATFSSDGARVITASFDKTARIWEQREDGRWEGAPLELHEGWVLLAAFASEDARMVTASVDGAVGVWASSAEDRWGSVPLEGHRGAVSFAVFSPDGGQIFTASADGTARVWMPGAAGQWQSTLLEGHQGRIVTANYSTDGASIVTASDDGVARVWKQDENGRWQSSSLVAHLDSLSTASFSPDGAQIVSASADGTARVWTSNPQGQWSSTQLEGHEGWVFAASYSPDGRQILTASEDGTARVWTSAEDNRWSSVILEGHSGPIRTATFSSDAKRIVTASYDGTARVWYRSNVDQWESTALEGHVGFVVSASFSGDGARIVTASDDGTARVWRMSDVGGWIGEPLEGHDGWVSSAAFSPDSSRVVTSSFDRTARVWELGEDGRWESNSLDGHTRPVTAASFSPDGARIVTASEDGSARVWVRRGVNASGDGSPSGNSMDANWGEVTNGRPISETLGAVCEFMEQDRYDLQNKGKTRLAELTKADLQAAPLLRSLNYRAGDNVCRLVRPRGINAILSTVLPRVWWTGLDRRQ